ncbi:MAG: PAS domain S-box protein, partial [Thermoanaerobaculia bacterium]
KQTFAENARLIRAVEQAAESILMTDPQGAIVYVNPAFERISGWTSEEALGQNPRILKSDRQDDAFYRAMWETLVRGEVWSGRLVNRARGGSLFEEEATISPLRDSSGKVVNYVAAKRDITSERRLEQQLFQAQKMESIGRLAAGIAHDFNNLLGVISGYGEIVRSGLPAADPLVEDVDQILKAAERAADSTRQLLAFGRQQDLQAKVVDLNAIVSDSAKILPRLLGEDVELSIHLAPAQGSVRADPGQLNQVLMNLVLNSRDALPAGGRITIETSGVEIDAADSASHSVLQPGPYVVLAVSDTGVGMDEATQARAFEPFFTTKASGKGTGLGLAAAYGIVNQSGGEILVYSEVGVGTTFKVYLPRVDPVLAEQEHAPAAVAAPRVAETVLLVEDESALREMIRKVLATNGYRVLVARDGSEALEIAAAHPDPIQLLVSDVIMPGLNGPRIAELLGAERAGMKVLFISGYSGEAVFQRGMLPKGTAFLSKPFPIDALLRMVREILGAE